LHDGVIVTDHFGGPGRAIDPVCVFVCLSECRDNNNTFEWNGRWPRHNYGELVHIDIAAYATFEGQGHRSQFTVTGRKCRQSGRCDLE